MPAEPVVAGDFGSDVVMAAAQVLHEGTAGREDPRQVVTFQAAHRPHPGIQDGQDGVRGFGRTDLRALSQAFAENIHRESCAVVFQALLPTAECLGSAPCGQKR